MLLSGKKKLKVLNTVKKELTQKEEKDRIFSNLVRLSKISKYELNDGFESHGKRINVKCCTIDRSGREKLFFNSSYSFTYSVPISSFGMMECNYRNYAVVRTTIKEFLPYGVKDFRAYMPLEEFKLWTSGGVVIWGDLQNPCEWDSVRDSKNVEVWTKMNSVDICYEILQIIRRNMVLDRLKGNEWDL